MEVSICSEWIDFLHRLLHHFLKVWFEFCKPWPIDYRRHPLILKMSSFWSRQRLTAPEFLPYNPNHLAMCWIFWHAPPLSCPVLIQSFFCIRRVLLHFCIWVLVLLEGGECAFFLFLRPKLSNLAFIRWYIRCGSLWLWLQFWPFFEVFRPLFAFLGHLWWY